MVIETLGDWLRSFLVVGIPGIIMALFFAWFTGKTSQFLQGDQARGAAQAAQRKFLGGRVPIRKLTFPRYNRFLVHFFRGFALLMLLMWLGKLVQILLF